MNQRHAFIAAAAVAIAGTVEMAGWIALEPDTLNGQPVVVGTAAVVAPVVTETEAAVLPPPDAAELDAAPPVTSAGPAPAPRADAPKTVPAPRWESAAARTGIARSEAAGPAARAERAEPVQPAEPRTERAEPSEPVEPSEPRFREVTIPANAVLGVRLSGALSSETAQIEDDVEASVTRDVIANGRLAVPAGTRLLGSVNEVTRGGKFSEKARLGVRFHTLVLADGTRAPVRVDSVVREGESQARAAAAKIGIGTVGGAIIGGIMSGKKGAVVGGIAGAGAGAATVATGQRSIASLGAGTPLSVRLTSPVTLTIERDK
ncbi:MAG: hypothetical protein M3Q55_05650 [Acidobacteriota bacterium]|nr:hypothetical protein [Acidobacteriota bacterium]